REVIFVVPAKKAGTHSPCRFVYFTGPAPSHGHGVGVPVFAGTAYMGWGRHKGISLDSAHARSLAAARKNSLPRDPARAARHAAGQCRLSLQPDLRALSRRREPLSHRGNVGRG